MLSTASVSYHVCSGFLTKCMLFSGFMELSDVTDSHLQQFRKFPRQTLVKTRGCLCQMKAALLSLLLKHSQDQALQTEGRTVSTRRRARLLEVAAVTGCKLASDKLRLVTYSFVAQVSLWGRKWPAVVCPHRRLRSSSQQKHFFKCNPKKELFSSEF